MPTFKHLPTDKRFFFAHIPRTAGRFVEANLLYNNNDMVWDDDWKGLGIGQNVMNVYKGIELAHFDRHYYQKYLDTKDIPHFSIVRNPITRFKSASIYLKRYVGGDVEKEMEDPKFFSAVLQAMVWEKPESLNWYRPQVDFMTKKTHVWKFEDGIKDGFVSWLSGIIGIDLKFNDDVQYPVHRDEGNKFTITPSHIDNIRNYYKDDFTKFYPDQ